MIDQVLYGNYLIIRHELKEHFRSYTNYVELRGDKVEFTLYMVINGCGQRLDWEFDLNENCYADLDECKKQMAQDIATLWLMPDCRSATDLLMGIGKNYRAELVELDD